MKKLFAKIISLAIVIVMSLFTLSGCQLITVNAERDMAQVIATVVVDDAFKDKKEDTEILKYELVSAYNSEGYYYVQYQGMSEKETYELLLEGLVKNKILVQKAKIDLAGENGYFKKASLITDNKTSTEEILSKKNYVNADFTSIKKTDSADLFLTEYEYLESKYAVLSYARQLIEGYKDVEDDAHNHDPYESFQGTARATITLPTDESYDEYEMQFDEKGKLIDKESNFYKSFAKINKDSNLELNLDTYQTKYELACAVYKEYDKKFINLSEDRVAINKLVKDLKSLGFISDAEASKKTPASSEDILSLTYFAKTFKSQCENAIISKYEKALINEQEGNLAKDEALYNAYKNVYETQKAKFQTNFTAYETALENATDESLVLYNPTASEGKYGYVLNLLIGFSDEQSAILASLDESTTLSATQKEKARQNLLETLTAKDLRDTWVESNYGSYSEDTGKFTFDSKYLKSGVLNTFDGNIYGAKKYTYHDDYDDEKEAYSYKSVKANEISFDKFYSDIVCNIMGFEGKSGKLENYSEDHLNKFKDIIYAYSTDPGSLSDNYGYVYSPKTSKDKYVLEFADCAESLVKSGVGSYAVVATEFGYHILLCTKVVEPTVDADFISFDTFKAQATQEGTLPYLFKEYQKDALIADNVSKITDAIFNSYLKESVKYNKEYYKDLIS